MKCDKCGRPIAEWETYYEGKINSRVVKTVCIDCYIGYYMKVKNKKIGNVISEKYSGKKQESGSGKSVVGDVSLDVSLDMDLFAS